MFNNLKAEDIALMDKVFIFDYEHWSKGTSDSFEIENIGATKDEILFARQNIVKFVESIEPLCKPQLFNSGSVYWVSFDKFRSDRFINDGGFLYYFAKNLVNNTLGLRNCNKILKHLCQKYPQNSISSLRLASELDLEHKEVLQWLTKFDHEGLLIDYNSSDTVLGQFEVGPNMKAHVALESGWCDSFGFADNKHAIQQNIHIGTNHGNINQTSGSSNKVKNSILKSEKPRIWSNWWWLFLVPLAIALLVIYAQANHWFE